MAKLRKAYLDLGFVTLIVMALMPPVLFAAPKLEGLLFPVTQNTKIVFNEIDDAKTEISGTSFKRRKKCQFSGLQAFYDPPGQGPGSWEPVTVIEGSKDRGEGHFEFGPWHLNVSRQNALRYISVYALHRCHPFWPTRTLFWGPNMNSPQ